MSQTEINIPEDFRDFLYWVKERTEQFWSKDPSVSTGDFKCKEWAYGAKWTGMSDSEIDQVEIKYGIRFMPEHREFLRVLHAIDRKEILVHEYGEGKEVETRPFFYNWLSDEVEIRKYLDWPLRTIYEDIVGPSQVWLSSWGERRGTAEEQEKIVLSWFNNASPLLPLTSHRFLVSDENLEQRPVLSVWGTDIIIMGWSLKTFLLREFEEALGLLSLKFDEEDKIFYPESTVDILGDEFKYDEKRNIPGWKEMILYWSSGWSGFGLVYPGHENLAVAPIVKAHQINGDHGI